MFVVGIDSTWVCLWSMLLKGRLVSEGSWYKDCCSYTRLFCSVNGEIRQPLMIQFPVAVREVIDVRIER